MSKELNPVSWPQCALFWTEPLYWANRCYTYDMWRVSLILGVLICELPAQAQISRFSFGAVGGARLSSGGPAVTHDESPAYTVGAVFEVFTLAITLPRKSTG